MGIFNNPFKREPDPRDTTKAINAKYVSYLSVTDEKASTSLLASLMQEANEAIIQPILKRMLTDAARQDSSDRSHLEDLCLAVQASVLNKVHKVRESEDEEPINDFSAYVAVVSYNKVNEYLRKKYPQRYKLMNRLNYALKRHPSLKKWADRDHKDKVWCGFAAWQLQARSRDNNRLRRLRQDPHVFALEVYPNQDIATINPADILLAVFSWVGQPILWNELIKIMVCLWDVKEVPPLTVSGDEPDHGVVNNLLANCGLDIYWQAICTLEPNERQALLLFADENGSHLPELLEWCADVSLAEIAQKMGMTERELAEIWNGLPWQDEKIEDWMRVSKGYPARLRMKAKKKIKKFLESKDDTEQDQ